MPHSYAYAACRPCFRRRRQRGLSGKYHMPSPNATPGARVKVEEWRGKSFGSSCVEQWTPASHRRGKCSRLGRLAWGQWRGIQLFRVFVMEECHPTWMSRGDVTFVNCCQVQPAWMRRSKFGAISFGPVSNWLDLRSRVFLNAPANSLILRISIECEDGTLPLS